MKPESATLYGVSGLLLLSALCVGGRHYVDSRPEPARAPTAKAVAMLPTDSGQGMNALLKPMTKPGDSSPLVGQMRAIHAMVTQVDRTKALLALMADFKREDWKRAFAAIDELGIQRNFIGRDTILSGWTEVDPDAAMDWAIENKEAVANVLRTWLSNDPDGALGFLESEKGKRSIEMWRNLIASAVSGLGNDLPRLARAIRSIPEKERIMVGPYLKPDFKLVSHGTLKPWVEAWDPESKGWVVEILLRNLPGSEAKLALARDFPEYAGPEKYGPIYGAWMKENEAEALAAFAEMEPGPLHKAALFAAVGHMYSSGRLAEAFELYEKWPAEVGQPFLSELLLCERAENAELILGKIPLHDAESLRLNRYRVALEMWFQKEPDAARKWLKENELPEIVRKEWEGK